jgi:DNA repair photolyase
MRDVRYEETEAKSVLNRVRGMGFAWSVNPCRGCVHGCHYCFARRYHTYLDLTPGDDFSRIIFVKTNAPAVLRAELSRPGWCREPVAVGTATDPYQPIEGRYRLTRGCLAALAGAATPTSLVTKGTMVVRDRDVLKDLAAQGSPGRARASSPPGPEQLDLLPVED